MNEEKDWICVHKQQAPSSICITLYNYSCIPNSLCIVPSVSLGKKRKYFPCNVSLQVVPKVASTVITVNSPDWMPFMPSDDGDGGDGQKKQVVNPHVELRE